MPSATIRRRRHQAAWSIGKLIPSTVNACKDGVSHNPAESIAAEDAAAVRALTEAIRLLAQRHAA